MARADLSATLTAVTAMASRASNQIATVIVTLVATRYLDPAAFGVFALGVIAITLIRTLLYSGSFEYLLKARDARDCSVECLCVNLAIAGGLGLLLFAGVSLAGRALAADGIVAVILALLPSNLISAVTAWREALLLRSGRVRLYYGLTAAAEAVAMAVAVAMLIGGHGIAALVAQVYARAVVMLLLYLAVDRGMPSHRFSGEIFARVLGWSVSRYGAVMTGFAGSYGADLLLGLFLSPAATGLYRASSRIVTAAADIFAQPVRTIAMTMFSARAAAGGRCDTIWPVLFAVSAVVGWSALAGLAALAPLVVPIVLGDAWRGAAALVPILCVARAFPLFDAVAISALVTHDEQRPVFYVQTAGALATVALIALAAPFGLVAATIAGAVGACILSVMLAVIAFRRLPGSGRALRRVAPALAAPVLATLAGAVSARTMAVGASPAVAAAAAISGGIAGWAAVLLLSRKRAAVMMAPLRAGIG